MGRVERESSIFAVKLAPPSLEPSLTWSTYCVDLVFYLCKSKFLMAHPFIIDGHGVFVGFAGRELEVREQGSVVERIPLKHISQLLIRGRGIGLSSAVVAACGEYTIPIMFFDTLNRPLVDHAMFGFVHRQQRNLQDGQGRLRRAVVQRFRMHWKRVMRRPEPWTRKITPLDELVKQEIRYFAGVIHAYKNS